jgi:hypothetical protein
MVPPDSNYFHYQHPDMEFPIEGSLNNSRGTFMRLRKQATCHPDRRAKAHGLCQACYLRQWKDDHPEQMDKGRRDHLLKKRQWLQDYKKTLKCNRCPESHPACLDFHHRDPTQKEFLISQIPQANLQRLIEELAKCEVLCANCHRKHHYDHPTARASSGTAQGSK